MALLDRFLEARFVEAPIRRNPLKLYGEEWDACGNVFCGLKVPVDDHIAPSGSSVELLTMPVSYHGRPRRL